MGLKVNNIDFQSFSTFSLLAIIHLKRVQDIATSKDRNYGEI